jgi:hypothetical protein
LPSPSTGGFVHPARARRLSLAVSVGDRDLPRIRLPVRARRPSVRDTALSSCRSVRRVGHIDRGSEPRPPPHVGWTARRQATAPAAQEPGTGATEARGKHHRPPALLSGPPVGVRLRPAFSTRVSGKPPPVRAEVSDRPGSRLASPTSLPPAATDTPDRALAPEARAKITAVARRVGSGTRATRLTFRPRGPKGRGPPGSAATDAGRGEKRNQDRRLGGLAAGGGHHLGPLRTDVRDPLAEAVERGALGAADGEDAADPAQAVVAASASRGRAGLLLRLAALGPRKGLGLRTPAGLDTQAAGRFAGMIAGSSTAPAPQASSPQLRLIVAADQGALPAPSAITPSPPLNADFRGAL